MAPAKSVSSIVWLGNLQVANEFLVVKPLTTGRLLETMLRYAKMPCMDDIKRLADDIYRERIIRARRTSSAEKLMEGPRLFDAVCERMKAGIRAQAPGADEDEVQQLLLQHIRRLRNVEEHAVYTPLECCDDGR
jgi:hypothetical protein